jgi:hypothetical protein
MAGILTRDTIISNGLELGGNPALTTLAQTFLNLVLDHLYRSYDWDFLHKHAQAVADPSDFGKIPYTALPADYRVIQKIRPAGVKAANWLRQMDHAELWLRRLTDAENAVAAVTAPTYFAAEGSTSGSGAVPDLYVWPTPSARLTYDLLYYRIPVALTGDTAPDFPHHMALVYAVADWCKDYERDTVQVQAKIAADRLVAQFRTNYADQGRANPIVLAYDEGYFPNYQLGRE